MRRFLAAGLAAAAAAAAGPPPDCRAVADDRARLACYDAAAGREAAPAPAAAPAAAAASPPAASPARHPDAEDLFGRDSLEAEALAREAAGIGRTEAIEAPVTRVSHDAYGKLEMELGNGQAWRQVDTASLPLKAGAVVRIRRAALDSYLLTLRDGGKSIRVRRVR